MNPVDAAWEAVLASPDDDGALQVLADALMEQGDPHGELIRLSLAKDVEGAKEYLAKHANEILGDAELLHRCSPLFARGFLEAIRVDYSGDLHAVLSRPVSRLLRDLRVSATTIFGAEDDSDPVERFVDVLATLAPPTVATLRFSAMTGVERHLGEIAVSQLTARLPALTQLQVNAWPASFQGATSASLRQLTINLQNPVTGLGEARFPKLESLALDLPFRRLDFPLALLGGEVAPKLKTLTISGALWPQQLIALSVSALLRGLTGLEIHAEPETGWYPALLGAIDSFAQLERLSLVADRHHPEWVQAVKAALPQVIIREPQLRL